MEQTVMRFQGKWLGISLAWMWNGREILRREANQKQIKKNKASWSIYHKITHRISLKPKNKGNKKGKKSSEQYALNFKLMFSSQLITTS